MIIRELELPRQLETDLLAERGMGPIEIASLAALLACVDKPLPMMYGKEEISEINKLWASEVASFYLGSPSHVYLPGNIDPCKALIIGQAEPDSPIALDYRTDPPRVIYLGDVENQSHWIVLAPSYEALICKLRSDVSCPQHLANAAPDALGASS